LSPPGKYFRRVIGRLAGRAGIFPKGKTLKHFISRLSQHRLARDPTTTNFFHKTLSFFTIFVPLNTQIGSIVASISTLLHGENRPFAPNQAISSGEYALRACVGKHTDRFGLAPGSDPQRDTKKGRRKWLNFDHLNRLNFGPILAPI